MSDVWIISLNIIVFVFLSFTSRNVSYTFIDNKFEFKNSIIV